MQVKIAKVREVSTVVNNLLNETTIGKDITIEAVDHLVELSIAADEILENTNKKIKVYNTALKKIEVEFTTGTEEEPILPKENENPDYAARIKVVHDTVNEMMNEEVEFTFESKLPSHLYPAVGASIYKRIISPWLDFSKPIIVESEVVAETVKKKKTK